MKNKNYIEKNNWWNNVDKFILIPTYTFLLVGIISISSITHHFSSRFYFFFGTTTKTSNLLH